MHSIYTCGKDIYLAFIKPGSPDAKLKKRDSHVTIHNTAYQPSQLAAT